MWQKIFPFVTLLAALMIFGCSDNSVSPQLGPSTAVNGETEFIQFVGSGGSTQPIGGNSQVQNQVAVFRDSSDNAELSGLRNVVINTDGNGNSYGTFSMVTSDADWQGNWSGTTTSSGTTIKATGYDLNDRGKSCVWYYYLPSSQDGTAGTFTARIIDKRD